MTVVIKQGFSSKGFENILNNFLFSDSLITIPPVYVAKFREMLVTSGESFPNVFQVYPAGTSVPLVPSIGGHPD